MAIFEDSGELSKQAAQDRPRHILRRVEIAEILRQRCHVRALGKVQRKLSFGIRPAIQCKQLLLEAATLTP